MSCTLCETRKPRRWCPGVRGEICAPCCGAEREVTVYCPLDCEYLRRAREHEKVPEVNPDAFPNKDVRVTEEFLQEHEQALVFTARSLAGAAMAVPGAVDSDVREALETLVRTYRTLESGLIYESRPNNPVAGAVHAHVCTQLVEFRQQLHQRTGVATLRDADFFGVLVFLQRLGIQHNNGRTRGRAFVDFLRRHFPDAGAGGGPPLIQG